MSKHFADVIAIALNQIKQTNDEKFDRSNFVKNVILDNILPGVFILRAASFILITMPQELFS